LGVLGADLFPILGALAVASLVIGSVLGLRQRSYARMLAYSGVAQVGFALVALASGSAPVAVLYGCVYAVATAGAFSAAEAIRRTRGHWDGSIAALSGIGRTDPVLGVSVSVLLLSLAGIPPLVGFWSKLLVLRSAVVLGTGLNERGHTAAAAWYAVLVVAAVAAAVVSLAYYGAVIRTTFEPGGEGDAVCGGVARSVTVFLALVVVILGLLPAVVPFDRLVSVFLF
jgi:NADH-quinone oxidoreductase subunit N